ncbi:MAG: hypothetical protein JM58_11155 [Peptococcaceae bacterium BICA1-8]|nr:MAG: hypothetical protein JM58_11155 [Peptococcaceae bacterium BICA1-8]
MRLEVRLFAALRDKFPTEKRGMDWVSLEVGSTLVDLMKHLELPEDIPLIIFVNGRRQNENIELADEDRVGIFPPVGGG